MNNKMFGQRTADILERVIREFIETGEPITSQGLYERYDFGIKPAMIRWELNKLTRKGYLYQNHPSGGRIPSDKAYGAFVESVIKELEHSDADISGPWAPVFQSEKHQFVQLMAERLETYSVWYESDAEDLYSSGLGELVENLEMMGRSELASLLSDMERIADALAEDGSWWRKETAWPKVFVGRNPITKSRNVSVVAERVADPRAGDCLMLAVGPKRMNYEKSIRLCKTVRALVE